MSEWICEVYECFFESEEQVLMSSGEIKYIYIYLRYRTKYEVKIQYANISDTQNHYTEILKYYNVDVLYLKDGNVYSLIWFWKTKMQLCFFSKSLFLVQRKSYSRFLSIPISTRETMIESY